MLLYAPVSLQLLAVQGKNFKWDKPTSCPGCKSAKVWGHGYVAALFNGFSSPLWLKRLRCNACKIVMTIRPKGFFSRFQTATQDIFEILTVKLKFGLWPPWSSPQRSRHWLRRFLNFVKMHYGNDNGGVFLEVRLRNLFHAGVKFLSELK